MAETFTMISEHKRVNDKGVVEYQDKDGYWMLERDTCRHCMEEQKAKGKPYRWAEERYSFDCYAGMYCDVCWPKSGYRDAVDPDAEFDPADAGEVLEPEDY